MTNNGPVLSFLPMLGTAFVVLKLCAVIDWSWWWVLLPFYGMVAFFAVFYVIAFTIGAFGIALAGYSHHKRMKAFKKNDPWTR